MSQPQLTTENPQKNGKNSKNELELRVVPSAEVAEDNFASPIPNRDEAEVALSQEEREDNFDAVSIQEAEPSETRDLAPTPMRIENEGGVMARPQRNKRPPAWLGDFVIGGELKQCLLDSQVHNTHVAIAQKQLDNPPLEIYDMWHLSDDEDRKERRLPGEDLDINWISAATKRQITDRFYEATASEGRCTEPECSYSTLSRRKLLEHIVTHYHIYVTDCNYLTSRRDSVVKHLRICHGWRGSITQADTGSWRRLRDSHPNLPTSCPPLPMSTLQYRQASKCSEERRDIVDTPAVAVKKVKISTNKEEPVVKLEEAPIVVVARRVELRMTSPLTQRFTSS